MDTQIDAFKDLVRQYHAYQDKITVHKLRLGSYVDRVILDYDTILTFSLASGLAVQKAYPSPRTLLKTCKSMMLRLLRQSSSKGPTWAETKYEALMAMAKVIVKLGEPTCTRVRWSAVRLRKSSISMDCACRSWSSYRHARYDLHHLCCHA